MTATFFLAGQEMHQPEVRENADGTVSISLNTGFWVTVTGRPDCAALMKAAADADSVFIRQRAAAEARAGVSDELAEAARPLVPQDPLTAAVEANARILREQGFYEGACSCANTGIDPSCPVHGVHTALAPLPDLPQREPGVALADIEFTPVGYQGAAQHTYTPRCDGFHEPGPCPPPATALTAYAVPSDLPRPEETAKGPVTGTSVHDGSVGPGQPDPLATGAATVVYGPHCHHDDCSWVICDLSGLIEFPCRKAGCPHCGAPPSDEPEHWAGDLARIVAMTPAQQARIAAYLEKYPMVRRSLDDSADRLEPAYDHDPLAAYQAASNELHDAEHEGCISCGAEVDHHLGCPDDPDPDYEAEAELQREQPQPGGTIYAELSEEALAAHAPLASLAADPDEDKS